MERLANYRAAAGAYGEGVRLNPQYAACLDNLARLLATCPDGGVRNGQAAVPFAERACAAPGGPNIRFLDTLAAAYAEAGRFDDAVAAAQRAIDLAQALGRTDLANEIRGRLVRYQGRQPLRQTQGAGAVPPAPGPSP
jgi:tetratricopeptide (TPR) repeat protein